MIAYVSMAAFDNFLCDLASLCIIKVKSEEVLNINLLPIFLNSRPLPLYKSSNRSRSKSKSAFFGSFSINVYLSTGSEEANKIASITLS